MNNPTEFLATRIAAHISTLCGVADLTTKELDKLSDAADVAAAIVIREKIRKRLETQPKEER